MRIAFTVAAVVLLGFVPAARGPALKLEGPAIQIDGRPGFLLGVSLFDALGATPPGERDLDAMKAWGVNTVRVWAHWHQPIYGPTGELTAQGRSRLTQLAQRLQSRGLILELVLLRPGQLPGQPFAVFASEEARLRALEAMTVALHDYRSVIFDLYNEHDHPDGAITHAALRVMRDRVKAIDAGRLVTVSSTGNHLMTSDGRVGEDEARHLLEEAGSAPNAVAVDVVAVHFPRTDDWMAATAGRVTAIRAALDRIDRRLPIYLNEERRAEPGTVLPAAAYRHAALGARQAGAAGWVFHTAAGFDLRERPFLDALTPEERAGLDRLRVP